MKRTLCMALLMCLLLTACGGGASASLPGSEGGGVTAVAAQDPLLEGIELIEGFQADVYASGLRGPTAMAYGPDRRLYVTQLNGAENAGTGQVVAIAGPGGEPAVVLDKLAKPTGIAWRRNELWLVAHRDILQSSFDGGSVTPPTVVVDDLPFNGRSNGQITRLPDDRLIFETSGGSDPNSAALLALKPGESTPQIFAKGFKGAYDHASDINSGAIWVTEINDDPLAGKTPPEELNQIREGKDYGWPRCWADQQPAPERGGSKQVCEATEAPIALFEPNATPTGVEWGGNTGWPAPFNHWVYVALWNGSPPRIVLVQVGDTPSTKPTTFMSGLKRPMDLLAARDGGLLVMDHEAGVIYHVRKT